MQMQSYVLFTFRPYELSARGNFHVLLRFAAFSANHQWKDGMLIVL